MSELAFNYKGDRIVLPGTAERFRVRRLREGQRGQLDLVTDEEGAPLFVPVDISRDDFRGVVNHQPGRYRLDALDENKMAVAVEPAYVTVPPAPAMPSSAMAVDLEGPRAHAEAHRSSGPSVGVEGGLRNGLGATVTGSIGTWAALPMPSAMSGLEYLLAEALRGQVQSQAEMMRQMTLILSSTMASQAGHFAAISSGTSSMISAAADLLRAADGAAMPRRPPPAIPAPPSPPTSTPPTPPTPTVPPLVYAIPRNAVMSDGDHTDCDGSCEPEDDVVDGTVDAPPDTLDKVKGLLNQVQGMVAPIVGMVMADREADAAAALRNAEAANGATVAAEAAPVTIPPHLRASHILAIGYELGNEDSAVFRRVLRSMATEDRADFVADLCALPLERAAQAARDLVRRLRARQRRSAPRAADRPVARATDHTAHDATRGNAPDGEATVHDNADDEDGDETYGDPIATGSGEEAPDGEADTSEIDASEIGGDEPAEPEVDSDPIDAEDIAHDAEVRAPDASETVIAEEDGDEDGDGDEAEATQPLAGPDEPNASATVRATALAVSAREASAPPVANDPVRAIAGAQTPRYTQSQIITRLFEISQYLDPREVALVQSKIAGLGAAERNAWVARLMPLDARVAAKIIRLELAERAGS
jgi:hypothetical protein